MKNEFGIFNRTAIALAVIVAIIFAALMISQGAAMSVPQVFYWTYGPAFAAYWGLASCWILIDVVAETVVAFKKRPPRDPLVVLGIVIFVLVVGTIFTAFGPISLWLMRDGAEDEPAAVESMAEEGK